ncbi:MAG TPA: trypsin-like peptidase domain-containing protein [Pseudomonadota bacterium]|nr:trypsin-like peptidase domain-containing protein [Pseudomonadota bacterium]
MIRRDSGLRLPVLASLLTLALTTPAFALPVGTQEELQQAAAEAQSLAPSWEELDAAAVDFTAIVALSNCSGSLVKFVNSRTSDFAMVLTNGHCTGSFIPAGDARVNVASSRTFKLLSSNGKSNVGTLSASKLIYGTMTGTDMALYLLTSTYAQIASRYRVAPLLISDSHPAAGTAIRVVSGFWRKIYSCTISKFVPQLTEGSWTWQDSIRYSEPGCEVIGGTSGSPIISASSYEVIGVNNTTNESGARCTVDNPCEVDSMGNVTVEKGASYGQQLYQLYTCVNSSNGIDLNIPGCKLQKPATP